MANNEVTYLHVYVNIQSSEKKNTMKFNRFNLLLIKSESEYLYIYFFFCVLLLSLKISKSYVFFSY